MIGLGSWQAPETAQHVAEVVRLWLGAPAGTEGLSPLPDDLVRLLLRVEEQEQPYRDQWGCWEHGFSDNYRRGALWIPEVDRWVAAERSRLAKSVALEPLWPNGARFVVCLTHDVDMIGRRWTAAQHLRSAWLATAGVSAHGPTVVERAAVGARALARAARFGVSLAPHTAETLGRCAAVERSRGIHGSYLFTVFPPTRRSVYDAVYSGQDFCRYGERRRRVRDVMRDLDDEGFDVGLHAGYCTAANAEALMHEKGVIEEHVGKPIVSCRQHFLHWDVNATPRAQAHAGIKVDTTVGFNRNIGFRAGTALPYRHFDLERLEPLDVLEVPLIMQESPLLSANALELDGSLARETMGGLFDAVAETGGVVTLLFHPHSLLDPRYLDLYEWSLDRAIADGAWVATLRDIREWWDARSARLASAPRAQAQA